MSEALVGLIEHLVWADRAVIDSLKSQGNVPARVMEILAHVLVAEQVWLKRIDKYPGNAPSVWSKLSLAECEALAAENADALRSLVPHIDGEGLHKTVTYVNSRGEEFENTLEDILLHVCMHGSYHRGQIAAMVRAGGGVPVNTDYIGYRRSQRGSKR
jgi:uncharacterized damage-inducible protein DinB